MKITFETGRYDSVTFDVNSYDQVADIIAALFTSTEEIRLIPKKEEKAVEVQSESSDQSSI